MEALLSVAFDNISSQTPKKIGKGLRQIEGLLAQICLSSSISQSPSKRKPSSSAATAQQPQTKQLEVLAEDLAFREFFRLQESFEWNGMELNPREAVAENVTLPSSVATRLIECLDRILGMGNNGQNDMLIISALDLVHGTLLLHPPSRSLFGRERNMNLLLDLLDPRNNPTILASTLLVLVCALLDQPNNTRVFEATDGILTVSSLFKSQVTSQSLKLKVVEFLYFYLMPETLPTVTGRTSLAGTALIPQRSPSKQAALLSSSTKSSGSGTSDTEALIKTTEEKQALLGRYLNNVEDLVQDLRENVPLATGVY